MTRVGTWCKAERDILAANWQTKMDKEIAELLRKAGFIRTAPAVKNERNRRGWKRPTKDGQPERRGGRRPAEADGWPVLRGESEERDRQFWQAVLRHAVECGEITITRAA